MAGTFDPPNSGMCPNIVPGVDSVLLANLFLYPFQIYFDMFYASNSKKGGQIYTQ